MGANHGLPLFHMAKGFIWINETKQRINEFKTGYIINQNLSIKKAFIKQVYTCMKNTFGAITQPHIRSTL